MKTSDKVLILGSHGLVGSALLRVMLRNNFKPLTPVRSELDLLRQNDVEDYFTMHKPDYVFMAAAKVGGILANDTYRADFIFENLQIQQNVFNAAFKAQTKNLLFLGSSCIYPRNAPQPLKEEYLLTSSLEPTNEPYAIAKIAGLKTAESFRRQYGFNWVSVMPTNLYGENDNFDLKNSHVIPGLIARTHESMMNSSSVMKVWGTGKPRREFLYVDDLANACLFLMRQKITLPDYLNIGSGEDIEIGELAKIIATKMKFKGKLEFDSSKPDGAPRKLLDVSKIQDMGWKPLISLDEGLNLAIKNFYSWIKS